MKLRMEVGLQSLRGFASLVGIALLAAAVIAELRKPAAMRTWHGRLADFVPYDLRPPSVARISHRLWSPEENVLIVGTPFGLGWTINFAALVKRLRAQ
jgi:hypothetical protein